jgi:hypothetical protein
MAKEVKVVWISFTVYDSTTDTKEMFGVRTQDGALTELVNQGWSIAAAGGGSDVTCGFVVLQRDAED